MWTLPPSSAMLGRRSSPWLTWHSVHVPPALVMYQMPPEPRSLAMCVPLPSATISWLGTTGALNTRFGGAQPPPNADVAELAMSMQAAVSTSATNERRWPRPRMAASMPPRVPWTLVRVTDSMVLPGSRHRAGTMDRLPAAAAGA
jgi:hypothetical protein